MKKWPFFAIILPWMASYGSEISFVLVFSARDDLGKVSWKMDARKCINQVTPPFFDHLSESRQTPLQNRDRVLVVGDLLLGAAPSGRSPSPSPVAPHLRTVAPPPLLFFPISDPPQMAIVPKLSLPRIFFQIWHIFYRHFQGKQPQKYFPWDVPFYFNHQRDNAKTLIYIQKL